MLKFEFDSEWKEILTKQYNKMILFYIIIPSLVPVFGQRNSNYNFTANAFIQQYYQQFDSPISRPNLKNFYDQSDSTLSLNGEVIYGANSIFDRLNLLPRFNNRSIHLTDNQPKIDGGSISEICGKFQYDNGTIVFFSEMISISPRLSSFIIQNHNLRIIEMGMNMTSTNAVSSGGMIFSNLANNSGSITFASGLTTTTNGLKFSG